MITTPKIEYRPAQPYAAVRLQAAIPFGKFVQPSHRETLRWLEGRGLKPVGAPFIRYLTTNMERKLDLEIGWPVADEIPGDERIMTGSFPAGRYAVLLYTGSVRGKGLYRATVALLEWANENHIPWQKSIIDGVEWWGSRLEHYLTDPAEQPDLKKWQTELAFLVAEG